MEIKDFQKQIENIYFEKDSKRGEMGTFAWLVEEVGELSRAIRRGGKDEMVEEFSDVFAWLASLASQCGVSMEDAASRYADGCPKCENTPCSCGEPANNRK